MYIADLINNTTFDFNAPFRIVHYIGGDDPKDFDRSEVVFDTTKGDYDIMPLLMVQEITAVNAGDDGVLEIEYTN